MRTRLLLFLFLAAPLMAQQAPNQPTMPEVKAQLAIANLQIARLTKQVHDLQFEVHLFSAAAGLEQQQAADQHAIEAAQQAVQDAQQKPETKPAAR